MAVNTFTGGTANWGTATNWSLGTVPTATDGHVTTFDNTSPNCTVNVAAACNNINFNGGTGWAGALTMTNGIGVYGNITLSAAAMTRTGAGILSILAASTMIANGFQWTGPVTFNYGAATTMTFTLSDAWDITGNILFAGTGVGPMLFSGFTLTLRANITVFTNGNRLVGGSTKFIYAGTGIWISGTNSYINNAFELNTSGTLTCNLNAGIQVYYSTSLFNFIAGTIDGTAGIMFYNCSITCAVGCAFPNINIVRNTTITILSDITITTLNIGGAGSFATIINGLFNLNLSTFTITSTTNTFSGTATYVMSGTGTITGNNTSTIENNLEFNSAGTITMSGALILTSTFTITAYGSLTLGSSTISLGATSTLTVNRNNVTLRTITIAASTTFNGTYGFTLATLTCIVAGVTLNLKSTNTYTITTTLTLTGTAASHVTFLSSVGGSQAIIILLNNGTATHDVGFVTATDIDSSGGQTIWNYKGTHTRTSNWNLLVANTTKALIMQV